MIPDTTTLRALPRRTVTTASLIVLLLFNPFPALAAEVTSFRKPIERDKCAVCGMFVAKYPDWIAEIIFRDGSYLVFDGAKDLFYCLGEMKKYAPGRSKEDIQTVYVMDYYLLEPIDGFKAWYVGGSDVYGPMGAELIPFRREADAREFLKDHQGSRILRFSDINPQVLKTLK